MSKKNTEGGPLFQQAGEAKIIPLVLLIGDWRNSMRPHDYYIQIAETLTHCISRNKLDVTGYLITGRRLYLVLFILPSELDPQLDFFYEALKENIRKHAHHQGKLPQHHQHEETPAVDLREKLFTKLPLLNEQLVKLITGKAVKLPYYSPQLARLKDKIKQHAFCSAIDYSGGKGPVVFKKDTVKNNKHIPSKK